MDGRPNRRNKDPFSNSSAVVWLGPYIDYSTHDFETRTATGRKNFVRQDRIVSQIFMLLISNGEKILNNVNAVG